MKELSISQKYFKEIYENEIKKLKDMLFSVDTAEAKLLQKNRWAK